MNATISIDKELKKRAEVFLDDYGMSLSDMVSTIISRMINNNTVITLDKKEYTHSAFGSLSKYANTNLRKKEKDAWEIYVREKYASN